MSILLDPFRSVGARTPPVLLAFCILLLTTERSPAPVTVLPETTPTPAPKHDKEKKHSPRPEKPSDEPSHQSEKTDPELAKGFDGVWRGRTSGKSNLRGSDFSSKIPAGTMPEYMDSVFIFSEDAQTISWRCTLGAQKYGDGWKKAEGTKGAINLTAIKRIDARTLKAEYANRGDPAYTNYDRFTFHLESPSSLRVEHKSIGQDGFTWSEDEGVFQR